MRTPISGMLKPYKNMKILLGMTIIAVGSGAVYGLFVAGNRMPQRDDNAKAAGSIASIRNGTLYYQDGNLSPMPHGGVTLRRKKIKDILESVAPPESDRDQ